jgi:hypothetical protein
MRDVFSKNQAASKSIANVTKLTSDAIRTVVALAAGTLRIEKKNPAQKNK